MNDITKNEIPVGKKAITTGVSLVAITNMKYYRDNDKNIKLNKEGNKGIIVEFQDSQSNSIEQLYWIDGNIKQSYFDKMLLNARIDNKNKKVPVSEVIGKRLYIAVKEIRQLNENEIVEHVQYRIFRYMPFKEGGPRPALDGDPGTIGEASGMFVEYRDYYGNIVEPKKEEEPEDILGIEDDGSEIDF